MGKSTFLQDFKAFAMNPLIPTLIILFKLLRVL